MASIQNQIDSVNTDITTLLDGINAITGWITQHFGVQLIPRKSPLHQLIQQHCQIPFTIESETTGAANKPYPRRSKCGKLTKDTRKAAKIHHKSEQSPPLQLKSSVTPVVPPAVEVESEVGEEIKAEPEQWINDNDSSLISMQYENQDPDFEATTTTTASSKKVSSTNKAKIQHLCSLCGTSFSCSRFLIHHKQEFHTPDGEPFKCLHPGCLKTFNRNSLLKKHKRIHEKKLKCPDCGVLFAHMSKLKLHQQTHTGERNWGCQLCKMKFVRKSTLQNHELTHTGSKPYLCHSCDKSFTREDHLKTHLTIHTGDKPYKCEICGKLYRRNDSFYYHKKTHLKDGKNTAQIPVNEYTNTH